MEVLFDRVLEKIKTRQERINRGEINCIPTKLRKFKKALIGIEQGIYYLITAAEKSYKTQFTSYLFLYTPILYSYYNPDKAKVHVLYFPLEETPEKIICRFICYILYNISEGRIHLSVKDLMSTDEDKPLPDEILNLLEEDDSIKDLIAYFIDCITFSTSSNPTGIYKEACTYAAQNGTIHHKLQKVKNNGVDDEVSVFDYYEPADENLYTLIYVDHLSLITNEAGKDQRQSMNKVSEYMVLLRNRYNFTPVIIQQQAFESMDNYKLGKLRPTTAKLGDAKYTSRDCNMCLGLFVPFKYELKEYKGYDVSHFRNHLVFLECIVNRDGDSNDMVALYADGEIASFRELPNPDDKDGLTSFDRTYHRLNFRVLMKNLFNKNNKNSKNNGKDCSNYWSLGGWQNNISYH